MRVLYYLEHAVTDGRLDKDGQRRMASRQVHFIETNRDGEAKMAGWAPYLDYRPLEEAERPLIEKILEAPWLKEDLEARAVGHAVARLVPAHLDEVRKRREELVEKTKVAVKDRLTKEINYWDHRAEELRAQEQAGRTPRLNSAKARQRADELQERLKRRLADLELERQVAALPPVVVGAALVIPVGLLNHLQGAEHQDAEAIETARIEMLAMDAVMAAERALGYEPRDVSADRCGYDIESSVPGAGTLRFIEVKGRHKDGKTITVTKNEILTALNKPDAFMLAIVQVDGETACDPRYVLRPFQREPDFGVTSVNYDLAPMLKNSSSPV